MNTNKTNKTEWSKPSGLLKNSKTLALNTLLTKASKETVTPARAGSLTTSSSDRYRIISSDQLWHGTKPSLGFVKWSWLRVLLHLDAVLDVTVVCLSLI